MVVAVAVGVAAVCVLAPGRRDLRGGDLELAGTVVGVQGGVGSGLLRVEDVRQQPQVQRRRPGLPN
jgi:hypothetical protein